MFISGGLFIVLGALCVLLVGVLIFSRKLTWFGRLPGDIRYEGRRARVYAPLGSMLLLSLALSLLVYVLGVIF